VAIHSFRKPPSTLAAASAPPFEAPALLNLLIDDDRSLRDACRQAADALGYHATTREFAEQALRLIESRNIDVVLLGLKLPDVARLALLRRIKQIRPGRNLFY